jgi:hypothetical protein
MGWVKVRVEHAGKPVSAASVLATTPAGPREIILSPDLRGEAKFFGLPFGQVKISAKYSFGGETKSTAPQLLDLKKEGADTPELIIAIPDPVETLGAPEKAAASMAPAKEEPSSNIAGKILGYLLGLLFAVGAGYGILKLVQRNEKQIAGGLGKLGVHVPTDEELNPDQGNNPVIPIKPAPVQPIVLDPVAPIDQAIPPISMVANPRLVGADGSTLLIAEGGGVVGREATSSFPVPQDSVSRQHARISRSGDSVIVADLGSTNKTFVNGVPISGDTTLQPGDSVQFGTAQFRYEV